MTEPENVFLGVSMGEKTIQKKKKKKKKKKTSKQFPSPI